MTEITITPPEVITVTATSPTAYTITVTQPAAVTVTATSESHLPVTIGTANGLSLAIQTLSLGLASAGVTGALSGTDWSTFNAKEPAITILTSAKGGTGVNNSFNLTVSGTSTINGSLVGSMTGGGTLATGGFTLTVPEAMTTAGRNVANIFTEPQYCIGNPISDVGAFNSKPVVTALNGYNNISMYSKMTANLASNEGTYVNIGLLNQSIKSGAGNLTSTVGLRGAQFNAINQGSGSVTSAAAFFAIVQNTGTGTITSAYGAIIYNPTTGASSPITNSYGFYAKTQGGTGITTAHGLYLESQTGATTNYAIFTNAGINRLGDRVIIVGSADVIQSRILANSTQNANIATWESSAGAVYVNISGTGVFFPRQTTTAAAPAYVKGGIYFDTTLNKLMIGGATAWEAVTSV